MIEALIQLLVFLIEAVIIVVAVLIILSAIGGLFVKDKPKTKLKIKKLNKAFQATKKELQKALLSKKEFKQWAKSGKKDKSKSKKHVFVVEFNGDVMANQVIALREEISGIISVAKPEDEVVLKLESGGGVVHGYGLAASQLSRLREHNIPLTVCIDKVAASGGYLMASCADKIIAAPFAIIGSIGVLAQLPNFHRWLKERGIDFEQITAGKYKRTLTVFGENTDESRAKFKSDMEDVHHAFKQFVATQRPEINIDEVATGEHWLASQAKTFNLVDELKTSDDYLAGKMDSAELFQIRFPVKKRFGQKAANKAAALFTKSY